MYAIVETGGKQYRVSEGDRIAVEKLDAEPGQTVELDRVLLVQSDDGRLVAGKPVVDGARVIARVEEQGKRRKILVFHYRHKVNYRKRYGHRQPFTRLVVEKVIVPE